MDRTPPITTMRRSAMACFSANLAASSVAQSTEKPPISAPMTPKIRAGQSHSAMSPMTISAKLEMPAACAEGVLRRGSG